MQYLGNGSGYETEIFRECRGGMDAKIWFIAEMRDSICLLPWDG